MRSLTAKLFSLCMVGVFTLALSNQVALACLGRIHTTDRRGDMDCYYTHEDADWCYYSCTCKGNCDAMYAEWGLESY